MPGSNPGTPLSNTSEEEKEMQVIWTSIWRGGRGAELCRDEKEAAKLVLTMMMDGVRRHHIIVDGKRLTDKGCDWIWSALGV